MQGNKVTKSVDSIASLPIISASATQKFKNSFFRLTSKSLYVYNEAKNPQQIV